MIQEKLFGNIGLNRDDDPRYYGPDDTDYIRNMLPDTDGAGGCLVSLPGNVEILSGVEWEFTTVPKVIGSCKRPDNDIIYYFVKGLSVHGSNVSTTTTTVGFDEDEELDYEYNSIIEFNPVTEQFRVIVFEEEFLYMGDHVYGAMVFGDYIIYNSGEHGMRKVNIEYAYRYYNSVAGDTYPEITETTFALRNLPPMDRPVCTYATDNGRRINNIINKTFQFAYRYKYRLGGYSVYSEFSDICLPPNVEKWNGEYVTEQFGYNYISVTFTRGDATLVEYVEVIVREGNDGDWRFYASIEDDVSSVSFYNDEDYESVKQDEVNKIEDAIPLQVADAELINENRLVLAGLTEGFAKVEVNASMWPEAEPIVVTNSVATSVITAWEIYGENIPLHGFSLDTNNIDETDYDSGNILRIEFIIEGLSFNDEYVLTVPDLANQAALLSLIHTRIGALLIGSGMGVDWVKLISGDAAAWNLVNNDDDDIEIKMTSYRLYGGISIHDEDLITENNPNKWNTYKSGATHPHAIQYWDEEFRRSTIMRSPALNIVVPERSYYASPQGAPPTTEGWDVPMGYRVFLNWTISHLAPSWARHWSWVYAGNKTQSWFVQYVINGVDTATDDYLRLDISPLQDLKTDSAPDVPMYGSVLDPYEFVEGDRVRILTGIPEGGGFLGDSFQGDDYYDLPIAGIDGNELLIASPDGDDFGAAVGSLIEIYTPRTFDEQYASYFLVGKINDVVNRYHMNPDGTDQSAGVDAAGELYSGDAYVIARAFSYTITDASDGDMFPVESMHWSDFYQSNAYDRGKINIFSNLGQATLNNIRWGWKHFEGSSVDNMFTFDPLDYKPLTDIYGDIVRIGEMGDVLKVLFERKVASMYIGKREIYDASGSVFTAQDTVLGNANYSIDDYGTTVPQAVLFVRGYCYFIDLYAGAIIRNTNNGSYPISGKIDSGGEGADYKMQTYFRDLCADVLETGQDNVTMLMGWDDGRKLLYVSILSNTINPLTVVFRESRGRWVAFVDFYDSVTNLFPTCYQWAGNKFFSWLDESDSVWNHSDSAAAALEIYNDAKIAYVAVWGNDKPNMMKVYDSISIHTDIKEWDGIVTIPESINYPDGMESVLMQANFKSREGSLHADYLFNALTSSGVFSALDLYRGESLRGYTIKNLLHTTEEAKLFKVDINSRLSNV